MPNDTLPITAALISLRRWIESNLPMERSALAYDLILLVVHHTLAESPISLKELFHSLPYSETGVRKQLKRFLETGQMRLEISPEDSRVRQVLAEPPLIVRFEGLVSAVRTELGPLLR